MKSHKRVFIAGLIMGLISLSGCHGSGNSGHYKVRWVNEADSSKVLEMTLQNPSVLGRVHMSVFGGRVRGSYVFKDGETKTEGRVTQLEDAYRLTSSDGNTQHQFKVDRSTGTLKDESGKIWKADNSPATATLKEW